MSDDDEYIRVELATACVEAWFHLDGGVTVGVVIGGRMRNGVYIRPADARIMFAARPARPSPEGDGPR